MVCKCFYRAYWRSTLRENFLKCVTISILFFGRSKPQSTTWDPNGQRSENKNILSMDFRDVMQAGLNGSYHSTKSDFFGVEKDGLTCNRLRGNIHELNSSFAAYMRDKSHMRKRDIPRPVDSSFAAYMRYKSHMRKRDIPRAG